MIVDLLGVRGSTPAPGAAFLRVGGHTSCLVLRTSMGDTPHLVLDAGTGIRYLGRLLDDQPFSGTVMLTHLHWDHSHGLPFCPVLDHPGATVRVLLPEQGSDAQSVLARSLSPPHFPIGPDGLRGTWEFATIDEGTHDVEGWVVTALEVPHPGGRTFGYRVTGPDGASVVYVPDHGPAMHDPGDDGLGAVSDAMRGLVAGADVLFHDSQHVASEFPEVTAWGHSAVDYAARLAEAGGVGRLVLTHHAPHRTDDEVEAIAADLAARTSVEVVIGREGDTIKVEATAP